MKLYVYQSNKESSFTLITDEYDSKQRLEEECKQFLEEDAVLVKIFEVNDYNEGVKLYDNFMDNVDNMKTSNEWQKLHSEVKVLDPDGWDRTNYKYSWFNELITFKEYTNRLLESTCKFSSFSLLKSLVTYYNNKHETNQ